MDRDMRRARWSVWEKTRTQMEARPGRWPVTENESSVIAKGTRPVSAAQMAHDARHVMFFTKTFRCLHCMAQVALTARSSLSRCPHFKHARGQTCKEQGKSDEFSDDDDSGATLIELVHGQVKADVIARRIREHAEGFACRRMAGAHDTEPSFVRKRSAEMGEISRLQNRGVAARLCAVGVRERGQEQTRHERDEGVAVCVCRGAGGDGVSGKRVEEWRGARCTGWSTCGKC